MSLQPRMHDAEPVSKARLRLWLRLMKASHLIEDQVRRNFRENFQTTLPRFDVMSALSRYPDGLKMSQISELLRVTNGNVTGIVDRLVEEALALRIAVPGDRRASLVRLTKKGRAAFEEQAAAHENWIDAALADFDAGEADNVGSRLDQLSESLEENRL